MHMHTQTHTDTHINPNGNGDSFLTYSGDASIKRSLYAHQLTLASLTTSRYTDIKVWNAGLKKKSTSQNIEFRACETKSDLFIRCVEEMLPSLAALDHMP